MPIVDHRPSDLLLLNIKAAISNLDAEITRQRTNIDTDISSLRGLLAPDMDSEASRRAQCRIEHRRGWLADLRIERDALRADYDWLLSLRADAVTVR